MQESLLAVISGEEDGVFNRFMVGDIKQSIYRFRQARPELFLEKYLSYEDSGVRRRIDLTQNYRSRHQVLDSVNQIFEKMMTTENGGVEYDEKARLNLGATYSGEEGYETECLLVKSGKESKKELDKVSGNEAGKESGSDVAKENGSGFGNDADGSNEVVKADYPEAKAVAKRIHELVGTLQVTDKETKTLRPAQYRDIVLLVRGMNIWEESFKAEFDRQGIPVYVPSRSGYFAAKEVQEVLQFIRMIDNPSVDIPMFGVMKSIFGGFTEEEIATIRAGHKDTSLYETLILYTQIDKMKVVTDENGNEILQMVEDADTDGNAGRNGSTAMMNNAIGDTETASEIDSEINSKTDLGIDSKIDWSTCIVENVVVTDGEEIPLEIPNELRAKICTFVAMIKRYRKYTMYMTIREILQKIMEEFDYIQYVTALPAGGKRRANVEMLLTKASEFEKSSYFGLFHFVQYIEQLERLEVDYGEADMLDEFADVVKVMTIHKSKGLEFPIVFVVGLNKQFNFRDTQDGVLTDTDFGVAVNYIDTTLRVKNKTLRKMTLANKMKEDMLAEEMRVLYVALTRAKEKLIMSGTLTDKDNLDTFKLFKKNSLSYLDFISARRYFDFILPILQGTDIQCEEISADELAGNEIEKEFAALEKKNALRNAQNYANADVLDELNKRFSYRYSHDNLKELYTKTTVSELKIAAMADGDEEAFHEFEEKPVVPYIPEFKREEETVTGTIRGNAYHKVMELIDLGKVYGSIFPQTPDSYSVFTEELKKEEAFATLQSALKKQLLSYVAHDKLPQEYYDAVQIVKIMHFLQSELSYRMWKAEQNNELYREQPFVLGIPARRLREDFPEDEKVLIQGIIDAFFVEEDSVVLLDYKTDKIESLDALWKRYKTQIDYYKEALERLMQKTVKECILYSYYLEKY